MSQREQTKQSTMQSILIIVSLVTLSLVQAELNQPPEQNIRLDSLSDGPGILPFKLGLTRIISHDHTFLQQIDLDKIRTQIDLVQTQLTDIASKISNQNFPLFKHQILHLFGKLNKTLVQLESFEPKRIRRGLFDPLGTFIKSVTGNLDRDDALRFENAIKILQSNDQELSAAFNKHISLYKDLTIQQTHILNNLTVNQGKLDKAVTYLLHNASIEKQRIAQYAQLSQIFTILTENVQDLSFEMTRLENILAFSRTNSMHHSILTISDLSTMLSQLKGLYGSVSVLDLDLRYYYDIVSLGSYYVGKKIVIVLKFPIMSSATYDLYRLSPVPNRFSNIILPPFPYIATNSQAFMYLEAECPKLETWYICKQKLIHQARTHRDCIANLILEREMDQSCQTTAVTLAKEALLELDSQHYIISFPKKTKVQISCGQEVHRYLEGSYLASIPRNCNIRTPEFTIINTDDKLHGHAVEIMDFSRLLSSSSNSVEKSLRYNLTTIDLNTLHNIQHQVLTENAVKSTSADTSSIYHTTIPTYIVLLSAAALISILYYCHRRVKSSPPTSIELSTVPTNIPTTPEERRAATFALNIGK